MKNLIRIALVGIICLAFNFATIPAQAQAYSGTTTSDSTHKPVHKKKAHHKKQPKKHHNKLHSTRGEREHVPTAQIDLLQLGYDPGPADGVMGPKTRTALKAFQRDHHLPATGVLTPKTFDMLIAEAGSGSPMRSSSAPRENFFASHPDYYGYYGSDYANPNMFGPSQMVTSRFGNIEVDDQPNGQTHQYSVMLNGKQVFHTENQPSAINVSRTFNLDNSDAVLLTSYAANDSVCPYRHYLLVVRSNSNGLHPIKNCTRNYDAYTEEGSLFISFPGSNVDGWASGDTWRYEKGSLVQL